MRRRSLARLTLVAWLATLGAATLAAAQQKNPIELGRVAWLRNFDEAHAVAKKSKIFSAEPFSGQNPRQHQVQGGYAVMETTGWNTQ